MSDAGLPLVWFVAIVAAIPLVLWMLKRTPLGAGAAARGTLRTVAALPLAPNQRIVTVEVGEGADRRWLVLGVTAHQITTLHTMPPQAGAEGAGGGPATPPFAQLLGRLQRPSGRDAGGPGAT